MGRVKLLLTSAGVCNDAIRDRLVEMLGLVDVSIYPHIDSPGLPDNTMEDARRWAETIDNPAYAIDDETAISVVDGQVDVVSEGEWTRLQ